MLGLTTGFNIHSFAQKIKYTHLETAGPVSAGFSSETRAHHLEQEEDAKRENWSGLQGVQPGRGRERGAGEGSSVLQASPVPRTWRRVESREGANYSPGGRVLVSILWTRAGMLGRGQTDFSWKDPVLLPSRAVCC